MRRGSIFRISLYGLVAAGAVTLVALLIKWLPTSASRQMDRITFVYWFTTAICIGIFGVVTGVIVYSVLHFRAQPDDDSDGPPIHGHTGIEIAWTVVPAILVIAIGVVSAVVLSQNGRAGTNPLHVKVFAQQFAWRFEYPDDKDVKSTELVIPVHRNIRFDLIGGRRDPLVLGAGVRSEAGRRAGDRHPPDRHADADRELHAHLHGALRSRSRDDARAGARRLRARLRDVGEGSAERWRVAAALRARRRSRAPAAGAVTRSSRRARPARSGRTSTTSPPTRRRPGSRSPTYVKESIVDPDAYIVPGYQKGVMPTTFGQSLSAPQIDALVKYLTGSK